MRSFSLAALFFAVTVQAAQGSVSLKHYDLSPKEVRDIKDHHQRLNHLVSPPLMPSVPGRPFSEVEEAGYLFFSSDTLFNSLEAKRAMARDLPAGVTLVIFTEPGESRDAILADYRGLIDFSRVKVVAIEGTERGFWARDGLPIPILAADHSMQLVDSRYYHGFEPDDAMARWFRSPLLKSSYYYEGGNFMPNDEGLCVMVDNERAEGIPDAVFSGTFSCKKTIRLPFEKGIGHVDESVRFITSKIVLTDSAAYAVRLRQEGLDVRLLPRPSREYETYVNALLVNGTAFVPVYNERNQQQALDVYKAAGVKVVPIETLSLSNNGLGSIHCITMTYPKVPFQQILDMIGGHELK